MSKSKLNKIASIEEEIIRLENQKKQLKQQHNEQERKARNHRLCRRGGLWESLMPDTITLTDEQFKVFLEKTIMSEYARRILNELLSKNVVPADKTQSNQANTASTANTQNHTASAQPRETNTNRNEVNGTRVTG